MLFMVIEHFKADKKEAVYDRVKTEGRMLPEGLEYVSSWVETDGNRCFQIMRADHLWLFDDWVKQWSDLVEFEIIPIQESPTTD